MKSIYKFLFICLGMLLCCHFAFGQRNYSLEADQAFDNYQYSIAIDKYKIAVEKIRKNKVEKNRLLFQIGICYRQVNDTKKAEAQFGRLIKNKYQLIQPLVVLYYADALKSNANYADALIQYKAYSVLMPHDVCGTNGIKACALAVEWLNNPQPYILTNEKRINSAKDDWAPAFADIKGNSLLFSSCRDGVAGRGTDAWTGESFTDLFLSKKNKKNEWSGPEIMDQDLIVNTAANEGPGVFDKQFNTLYFTRCGNEKKKISNCQIYASEKKGNSWAEPVLIALCPEGYDAVHPCISKDELSLYFVSNMQGGQGDLDIWLAKRKNKSTAFGDPVNLGSNINTPGKEAFPFLANDTMLYFSSNYSPGMGGYDVFATMKEKNGWSQAVNIGYPVNSSGDDFGFIIDNANERGFLTSNRAGGKGGDDIYSFYIPPLIFSVKGTAFDSQSGEKMKDVIVKISDNKGKVAEVKTEHDGSFVFDNAFFEPNRTYVIVCSKENYFNQKKEICTIGLKTNKEFLADFQMIPIEQKPIVLPEILYDFAKWDIRPQYQDSLLWLVKTLKENTKLVIELGAHTDSRNDDLYNDALSQKRAESAVAFIASQGIPRDRMLARGYGKRQPRQLEKDYTAFGTTIKKETILNDENIEKLEGNDLKEFAHQLNRRTTFKVVNSDYHPDSLSEAVLLKNKEVVQKTAVTIPDPVNVTATTTMTSELQYTVQVGTGKPGSEMLKKLPNLKVCKGADGLTRLITGVFYNRKEAGEYCKSLVQMGIKDAFVAPIDKNRIDCQ